MKNVRIILSLLFLLSATTLLFADDIDAARAKAKGLTIDQLKLADANETIADLRMQVAELKSKLKEANAKLAKIHDGSTNLSLNTTETETSNPSSVQSQLPVLDEKYQGFRGIKWGTDLSKMSDMVLDSDEYEVYKTVNVVMPDKSFVTIPNLHVKRYHRTGEKLKFGEVPVKGITYLEFNGQFYEVEIDTQNAFDLEASFNLRYGEPNTKHEDRNISWIWKTPPEISISMYQDGPPKYYGGAFIVNRSLEGKLNSIQLEEAKKQIEKSKKDF